MSRMPFTQTLFGALFVAVAAGLIVLGVQMYLSAKDESVQPPYVLKRGTVVPGELPPDIQRCLHSQGDKKPWEYDWAACNVRTDG